MTTTEIERFFGSPSKAAEFFGVSPEAIYQWRKRPGRLIPKGRAAEAESRTKGELVYRPELYRKASKTSLKASPQE